MKMRKVIFMVLAAVAVCLAQAVNISGVVKNSSGSAIDGAMVRLGKADISTTTGSDGSFKLTGNITGIKHQINHTAFSSDWPFKLEDNRLFISTTKQTEVSVRIYDCNGKLLVSLVKVASAKDNAIALPSSAFGIQIYRVSMNHNQYTFKSITGIAANRGPGSSCNMIAPGKLAKAAAGIDDALLFTKTGYQLYRLPITNGDTSGIQATLTAWVTGTVADADGNSYQTIQYGNKVWTVENLRTTKYNDGSGIGSNYCFFNNTTDAATKKKWGALYNGSTAANSKLAPTGWHVTTSADWDTLQNFLIAKGYNYDGTVTGNKIGKSMAATTDWKLDTFPGGIGNNLTKNNASGFSALPGGTRTFDGIFQDQNTMGYWWTSTPYDASYTNYRLINCTDVDLYKSYRVATNFFSIRIVKN
jgi:uncharacterized protein (TIGR02145 family)